MHVSLFTGADSLRVRGERRRLTLTLLCLPLTLAVVGFFFQNTFTLHSLLLIVIGAMLFVALSRGRFLGGGVRIREGQFDEVYRIVAECARTIGVPEPHVFVRDDPFVPIVAVGTGEPYALVISAQWVDLFSADELRFLAGRELAHIASGHTKLTSLLSANGRENAVIAIAFGAWLRTIEYTADRVGLLCCRSLDAAFSAIAVSTFQRVGRKIDLHSFAEQRRELDAEPSLRLGEWLSATPYATNRIARLAAFARDPLFLTWSERFEARRDAPPAQTDDVSRFAGFRRRATAFVIDYVIVSAINPLGRHVPASEVQRALSATDIPHATPIARAVEWLANGGWSVSVFDRDGVTWLMLALYVMLLVGFAGQTLGMMICDLRVVGEKREAIGLGRTVTRYLCLFASVALVVGVLAIFRRVQPFEQWSRTRLVGGSGGGRA